MRTRGLAAATLSFVIACGTGVMVAQYYGPPGGPQSYGDRDWDRVPPEFRAAEQRGFRDGIDGAKKDFKNHRPPNVMNRDEYRNPHFIAPADRRDYLIGFRRGYEVAVRHIYGFGYARYSAPGY